MVERKVWTQLIRNKEMNRDHIKIVTWIRFAIAANIFA